MKNNNSILNQINSLIEEGSRPLSFSEACQYLDISKSYLYKLTSTAKIPHYKPNNKKIYFIKEDLKNWLLRNKVSSEYELEQKAVDYVTLSSR